MSYPDIELLNSTPYFADGSVDFVSIVCKDNAYWLKGYETWNGGDRGVCLLKEITARLNVNGTDVWATPYRSSGTSYSQFAIIEPEPGIFEVTRRTSGAGDVPPDDYVEPSEKQK